MSLLLRRHGLMMQMGGATSTLLTGLVNYWSFDELSADAIDIVSGNNGIIYGDVNQGQSGKIGNSVKFTSISTYIRTTSYLEDVSGASKVSISTWVKRAALNGILNLVNTKSSINGIQLWNDGKIYLMPTSGSANYGYFSSNDTNWKHLVLLFDGTKSTNLTKLTLYVNGVIVPLNFSGTIASSWATLTGSVFNFGGSYGGANGKIDDTGIWNRILTDDEVTELYNSGNGKAYPF